ncbi:MAG: 4-hydroxy-3-methylbut-2-enyl diphosphate reductase [Lachnospiraceae bacterium]|nr:4-hydroxy-3-methylbut-2-enyl diphosphate reductase [Lachnospiraceae bacterium]
MKVLTAKTAGFCFGVERAVREALSAAENHAAVYTYGPIVHNETVIRDLEEKGIRTILDETELSDIPKGSTILIRAHGIPKELEEKLRNHGFNLIDATCPFVKKIHRIAEKYASEGYRIVIAGNPDHPEVVGIRSYAGKQAVVLSSAEELHAQIPDSEEKICLVAQTTFNHENFKKVVAKIQDIGYNANIADTVCSATRERQEEAADLASRADVMIVIGGRDSSNSQKLYEICRKNCNRTYFIQTAADLCNDWWCGVNIVGITAGASTPKTIIQEVQTNVRKF